MSPKRQRPERQRPPQQASQGRKLLAWRVFEYRHPVAVRRPRFTT